MYRETKIEIGGSYYLVDNSYSLDLVTGKYPVINAGAGLSGDWKTPPVLVTILTAPFVRDEADLKNSANMFRIVEYGGRTFLVLDNFASFAPARWEDNAYLEDLRYQGDE